MTVAARIEQALEYALASTQSPDAPPQLAAAVRYAVFPGGARIRPKLCLAVAEACGEDAPGLTDAAATSIELLHCASLVHDDLPCFDDATTRRGKPSAHKTFGAPLAVLAGDALIVLAFETLARGATAAPAAALGRLPPLLLTVARSVGLPSGIVAGQAWECEPRVDLADYHRAKTGSLFTAATMTGAAAAGRDPEPWRTLGERLGEAYQVADDLCDATAAAEDLGKPNGRDQALGRPNAASQLGIAGAAVRLERLLTEAVQSVPDCPGAAGLRALIVTQALRFQPKGFAAQAA